MGGLVPFPRQTLYNSTKHALQGIYLIYYNKNNKNKNKRIINKSIKLKYNKIIK